MTDPDQFIAAARITSLDQNKKVLNCTYGGDSLKILQPPFECSLFILKNKPLSSTEVIKPAIEGISKIPGTFLNITVTSISFKKDKGSLKLSENSLKRINELALESIKGSWICIDKDILNEDSSLFVFQFMNSEVYEKDDGESIAIVVDYFDNGAQGILVTKTNDGIEVMVPFIDEFVTFNKAEKKMLIPSFRQFIQS